MSGHENGRATIREVYEIVARLETKFDQAQSGNERRLDSLERWRSFLAGAVAVISAGIPFLLLLLRNG